jgi:uncharacterized protein (DUF1800 family)
MPGLRKGSALAHVAAGLLWACGLARAGTPGIFVDGFETPTFGPASDAEAARFLDQATYGGRLEDIAHLRAIGYDAWFDEQAAAGVSRQKPYLDWLRAQAEEVYQPQRIEAFFIHSAQLADPSAPLLVHDDQLRQRVAFALSELMVVSDKNAALLFQPWALASYYDTLAAHALGNYRDLLEAVTLHPAMGRYLSMLGNRKSDAVLNIRPDENYAREVLQLFSIGLSQLNPDATEVLANGLPVPTYDQNTVRGFAHVFTGWNFTGCSAQEFADDECEPGNPYEAPWFTPMAAVEVYHDITTDKQLLVYPGVALPNGVLVHGGDAQAELEAALDNIFHHPNVGPFVSKHLIQRLTTSNPTPAYVARVAAVFGDNGSGVRGDLRATVRAVLLDPEARGISAPAYFGKVREPITKLVRLFRITDARSVNGRVFRWSHPEEEYGQRPLSAPSVFNFFKPDFAPPGPVRDAGLVSPEFQIHTDTQLVSAPNALDFRIFLFYIGSRYSYAWENGAPVPEETLMDYGPLKALAADPAALVDRLDLLMLNGKMSDYMRDILIARLQGPPPDNLPGQPAGTEDVPLFRVQQALYLIATSPEFAVQK